MFKTVRGMRDFFGEQERKRQYVIGICRSVFEKYGFEPLDTPVLEELGLLTKKGSGGEAIRKEIYSFRDRGDRDLGMRFDLTVPLGRYVASNPQLAKPFKRYAIGKVWRYDRPQKGRFREFTQADVDIIGVEGAVAEFEVIAATVEVFMELGLEFKVRVNDRRLLEALVLKSGVSKGEVADCVRVVDKQDKVGWEGVRAELKEKGISTEIVNVLKKSAEFEKVVRIVGSRKEGARTLKELFAMLKEVGLDKYVEFDAKLARGLDYYTGPTFEVAVEGFSCGGGGRYDKLVSLYGGKDTPGTGISYGIDRLLDVVGDKIKIPSKREKVFVFGAGKVELKEVVRVVGALRERGIKVEMDLMGRNVSKNFAYAEKKGFRKVVIVGVKELKEGKVTLKDLKSGNEEKVGVEGI